MEELDKLRAKLSAKLPTLSPAEIDEIIEICCDVANAVCPAFTKLQSEKK